MSDGIYAALSGAIAQERALDTVANNIANAGTDGFRGDRITFQESVSRAAAGPTPASIRYVEARESRIDLAEGVMRETGNPLDFALSGDAFFVVQTPNGERLTRAGNFMVGLDGVLRTRAGYEVLPENSSHSEIVFNPTFPITAQPDGTLSQGDNIIAQLRLARFERPEDARHEGNALYAPIEGATTLEATDAVVMQGMVESANVTPIRGMNELISVNRTFEAFQRVIQTFRSLDEHTAREVGRE